MPGLVMPCHGTTAKTKVAPASGWGRRMAPVTKAATAWRMWSPAEGWWTTRETVCCQLPPQQVLPAPRASGRSRELGWACLESRSSTAHRVAGETCATAGSKTTCTTYWRDREPGRSSTTRSCKFIWLCVCRRICCEHLMLQTCWCCSTLFTTVT